MVEESEEVTAGYPRIERLVETEDFDAVNRSFGKAFEELQSIAKKKSGFVKGKQARKAMRAYELTMELFQELLKLKYQMLEAIKKNEKSNK